MIGAGSLNFVPSLKDFWDFFFPISPFTNRAGGEKKQSISERTYLSIQIRTQLEGGGKEKGQKNWQQGNRELDLLIQKILGLMGLLGSDIILETSILKFILLN